MNQFLKKYFKPVKMTTAKADPLEIVVPLYNKFTFSLIILALIGSIIFYTGFTFKKKITYKKQNLIYKNKYKK